MSSSTSQQSAQTEKTKSGKLLRPAPGSIGIKHLGLFLLAVLLVIIANVVSSPQANEGEVIFLADDNFYPELLKDIDRAEKSIHCAIYMFKTDSAATEPTAMILSAMIQALER